MLSLTLHNFPEGFAVGISSLAGDSTGFVVMVAMAVHNIPEGIAIAVPVLAATGSRKMALLMTLISGMAEPLGALLALVVVRMSGEVAQDAVENLLCSVGGIMLVVAVKELLPEAWNYRKPNCVIGGTLLGTLLMMLTILGGA
jgi:ZIP family zinc transporter